MNFSTNALVLSSQRVGDADRMCVLLTERMGIVRAYARGAQRIKNKNFTSTSQFVYGCFQIFEHNDRFIIDEADYSELFLPLRDDIERLALAQYLCELAMELTPSDADGVSFLRLMYAALHLLARSMRPPELIKAATELRMLSMAGYQPNLVMCSGCGVFETDRFLFLPLTGQLFCSDCGADGQPHYELCRGATAAMRHIVFSELRGVYSFQLSGDALGQVARACEGYLLSRIEHNFTTLEFYTALRVLPPQ